VYLARFSSNDSTICYVLPVLGMTLFLHMEQQGQNQTTRVFRSVHQVVASGEKSAVSDCILLKTWRHFEIHSLENDAL